MTSNLQRLVNISRLICVYFRCWNEIQLTEIRAY